MSCKVQNLVNTAMPLLPMNVHDEVDAAPHVVFDRVDAQAVAAAHYQRSDPMDGFFGAAGVDRGKCSTMAGIHGVEQRPCLRSALRQR